MDFDERLQRAVQRGQHRREADARERAQAQLTEEQLRALHAQSRLTLSDHLEQCLHKLADSFPGFQLQTVVTTEGFGAKVTRDDLRGRVGQPLQHEYSHLELVVRSYTPRQILEVTARGTIANKEVLQRTHYQRLAQLDLEAFAEQIDHWILEYAERFAAA
jgi:hypothetical protein